VWYNWWDSEDAPEGQGVLSFGDLASDTCDSASWTSLSSDEVAFYPGLPFFDVTSVSRPATPGGACDSAVTANITIFPAPYFIPFYVSYQVQQLLVKASGAKWDKEAWWYVVEDASKAQPVTLQLANGATLKLMPNDYLVETEDGVQILYAIGFYNQDAYTSHDYIFFPQQFINNRCFSMNANSGAWSIANAIQSTETVYVEPSSSSSGDYDD